jgi:2-iminobutanoate/2-iminopropanoate deaminase
MKLHRIITENAPKAIGPYSQAITALHLVFCSGQIGIHPQTNELVSGGIEEQTVIIGYEYNTFNYPHLQ